MALIVNKKTVVLRIPQYTPLPSGVYSQVIPFKSDLIFFDAPSYVNDDSGNPLPASNLANQSGIISNNGTPSGIPPTGGMSIDMYGYKQLEWPSIGGSWKVQFDLQGEWDLDYAYVYVDGPNNGGLEFLSSRDGTTYTKLSQDYGGLNQGAWIQIPFTNTTAQASASYFTLGVQSYVFQIKSLLLYGRPTGNRIIKGLKLTRNVPTRNFDHVIGTNGFYLEHPEMMSTVSGSTRFYVEPDWLVGDAFRRTGSAIGKTPNDVDFRFSSSHLGSIDQYLQGFANYGTKVMFTLTTSPVMLRSIGTADAAHAKPVDPGFSPLNLTHTTNAMNYKFMARLAWQIAARYGNNKNVDLSLINLQQSPLQQEVRAGMSLIYTMEVGNEMDKWFGSQGAPAYNNPEELAAYMSAIYDGHQGRMGVGYGIKNADSSMRVSLISLAAGDNITYVRRILWWCDKNRGKGDYPFDLINYHYYNSSEGSQEVGDDTAFGLPPEEGALMRVNQDWSNLRDTYCPTKELWLTEVGWDEQLGGVFSPRYDTQFQRSRHKAYWLSRLFIVNEVTGVDVTNQYWYKTQGGKKLSEFSPDEPDATKFATSGMVEGIQDTSDFNTTPLTSYWYVSSLKGTLAGFKFNHAIMVKGVSQVNESIIATSDPYIWAVAYTNWLEDKSYIAIWSGTATFRTLSITLNTLTSTKTSVNVISNDEAEVRGATVGITRVVPVVNGQITLTINECPQFIELDTIGTKVIVQPIDIKTQKLTDPSNILIVWTDTNVEDVYARISKSTTQNSGYTLVYQGPTEKAQYTVTNLNPNLTYYFRVELISNLSEIILPDPGTDPDPSFDTTLNVQEQVATDVYYAITANKIGGGIAADSDSISTLVNKKGGLNLIYNGIDVPAYLGRPPYLRTVQRNRPYMSFFNAPHVTYATDEYTTQGLPFAFAMVMEYLPGQDYEGFTDGGDSTYTGNFGFSLRLGASDPSLYVINDAHLEFFKRHLVLFEFTSTTLSISVDGVLKGTISNPGSNGLDTITRNSLGVSTNNSIWNFYSMYCYRGVDYTNFNSNRVTIQQSIMDKWLVGEINPNPHIYDQFGFDPTLDFNTITRQATPAASFVNATTQQIAAAQYEWWIREPNLIPDGGNFSNQSRISTNRILNESEYLAYPDATALFYTVAIPGYDSIKGKTYNLPLT